MRRRIAEQNTLVERKKNVYDTTLNPVVLRPKTASAAAPRSAVGVFVGPSVVGGGGADRRVEAGRERLEAGLGEGVAQGRGDAQGCSRRLRVLDVAEGKPGGRRMRPRA